ncbi:MAG: hypothetical protein RL110_1542 [Bacteroidota bacterium]|jgi:outer membrane protein OmpA-like peptidoglycan-associated protein
MASILRFLLCLAITTPFAQKDPCITTDKKEIKALEPLRSETELSKASQLYQSLVAAYPNNAEIPYLLGNKISIQYQKIKKDPKKSSEAEKLETQLFLLYSSSYKKCPTFHAEILFTLATMHVARGEKEEALNYLKAYVEFPENDYTKLPVDHAAKKTSAQNFIDAANRTKQFTDNPVPFEPQRIVEVSTELDEYFPMISPDNELMFFTRKVNKKNLGDITDNIVEEFTVAERLSMDSTIFNQGKALLPPFNDGAFFNYGTATLSADNKEMIICACKKEDVHGQKYLNCDLYTTTYKKKGKGPNDYQWTPLVNMGPNINTPDGWEAQPSLSADGKTLFYTTFRKGSRNNDIYISIRQDDGTWSTARPFDEINTAGKDKSPFFHQDGQTLYFVSECNEQRPGVGALDIFYIRKTENGWTKPTNIGYPINTEGDELGLFVSTQGKIAYYSSYQNGNWDIYGFNLHTDARPKEVVILKGQLKDNNNQPVTNGKIEITYGKDGKKMSYDISEDDGKYAAVVEVNKNEPVTVTLKKEGAAFNSRILNPSELSNNSIKVDLNVEMLKEGASYTLNDILFESDSYRIEENTKLILYRFADYLKENSTFKIAIHGHTDDLGDDAKNMTLSENRAKSVMEFLIAQGISEKRLSAKGFGESKPKLPNSSAVNRAKNRRTEFLFIDQ